MNRRIKKLTMPSLVDIHESQVIKELERIADENDGIVNPDVVVKEAEDPNNPLHSHFDWDDAEGGRNWRRAQACALIRRVKLTIIRANETERAISLTIRREAEETRKYQSRPSERNAEGGYEPVAIILRDPAKRAELVASVLRELRSIQKRYKQLTELAGVWRALDEI